MRRSEIVSNLMRQRELRNLGWNPWVVVNKRDDAGVEWAARALVHALSRRLCVWLVLFANASGCTRCRCYPSEAESASGEISAKVISVRKWKRKTSVKLTDKWTHKPSRRFRDFPASGGSKSSKRQCSPCKTDWDRPDNEGCTPHRRQS